MTTSGSSDSDHDNFRCALGFEGTGIQIMVFAWFLYGFCFEGLMNILHGFWIASQISFDFHSY